MGIASALQGFVVIGVVVLAGYLAARANVGGPNAQPVLQRFAFFVSTPCLMFAVLSKENLSDVFTPSMLVALAAAVVTGVVFLVLARTVFHLNIAESTVGTLVSMYMNANNIGLPVATYILGDPAAVTPIILMQQVIFTPLALTALDLSSTGVASPKAVAKQLAHQPILIGVALGVAVSAIDYFTGTFVVPQYLYDPINIIGQSMVPLVLCAFGMSLRGSRPLADGSSKGATIVATVLKCVFMPLVALGVARLLGIEGTQLYACVVLASLPSAQNVFNYAARYNAGTTFARDGVLLTTVFSPLCILVYVALLS